MPRTRPCFNIQVYAFQDMDSLCSELKVSGNSAEGDDGVGFHETLKDNIGAKVDHSAKNGSPDARRVKLVFGRWAARGQEGLAPVTGNARRRQSGWLA